EMDFSDLSVTTREKGGGHADKVFGTADSTFGATEVMKKDPNKKVQRKKKDKKEAATSELADVAEETHTEETVGGSEATGSEATAQLHPFEGNLEVDLMEEEAAPS
ncbi:hypothetical protein Dimus_036929, partial [Dionaea muscipula]